MTRHRNGWVLWVSLLLALLLGLVPLPDLLQPLRPYWLALVLAYWLLEAPERRWLFLRKEAIGPCLDPAKVVDIGASNRRAWILAPGDAWREGCDVPADWSADVSED